MVISMLSGIIMVLTFCFSVGDIESALSSPTGQPYIQVLFNASGSHVGTTILTVAIATNTLCNTVNNVAAASRQLYAFARDQGLPFSAFLSNVIRDCYYFVFQDHLADHSHRSDPNGRSL